MKEWFQQLAQREQTLVMVAGGFAVFALIIMLGVRPVWSKAARNHELIEEKQSLLSELTQVAQRIGPQTGSSTSTSAGSAQSLVVVVDRTTRERGLAAYLKRNQPDGTSSIRLRFENVPFDTLMGWLSQLQSQYSLSTTSANIDLATGPGRVNCNLTLNRADA